MSRVNKVLHKYKQIEDMIYIFRDVECKEIPSKKIEKKL